MDHDMRSVNSLGEHATHRARLTPPREKNDGRPPLGSCGLGLVDAARGSAGGSGPGLAAGLVTCASRAVGRSRALPVIGNLVVRLSRRKTNKAWGVAGGFVHARRSKKDGWFMGLDFERVYLLMGSTDG